MLNLICVVLDLSSESKSKEKQSCLSFSLKLEVRTSFQSYYLSFIMSALTITVYIL